MSLTRRTIGCCVLIPEPDQRLSGVRAVLFDLDGTLVRPTIDFAQLNDAVRAVIGEFGAAAALTRPMPALEMIAVASAWLDEQGSALGPGLRRVGQRAILEIELKAAEAASAFAGVPEMLAMLADQGRQVAIVTRNSRPAAERIVAQNRLRYGLLLTRDDVERVKPDPAHLHAALTRFGVPPAQALMCGDHTMDIVAGKRAGARTVGVLTGDASPAAFVEAGADLVLACISELPAYLDGPDDLERGMAS